MSPAATVFTAPRARRAAAVAVTLTIAGLGASTSGLWLIRTAASQPVTRAELHASIRHHVNVPYSDPNSAITDSWVVMSLADEDPDNPDNVLTIYGNTPVPKARSGNPFWEHEHLWPTSRGTGLETQCGFAFHDIHHMFPENRSLNASRSNLPFDNCPGCNRALGTENRREGGANGRWEVWPGRRGDVARALFYMDVRYEGGANPSAPNCQDPGEEEPNLVLTDTRSAIVTVPVGAPLAYMGMLSTLLCWHQQDPPDDRERHRNDVIENYQGNRNPFIDNPEWVGIIWPDGPSYPSTACPTLEASSTPTPDDGGLRGTPRAPTAEPTVTATSVPTPTIAVSATATVPALITATAAPTVTAEITATATAIVSATASPAVSATLPARATTTPTVTVVVSTTATPFLTSTETATPTRTGTPPGADEATWTPGPRTAVIFLPMALAFGDASLPLDTPSPMSTIDPTAETAEPTEPISATATISVTATATSTVSAPPTATVTSTIGAPPTETPMGSQETPTLATPTLTAVPSPETTTAPPTPPLL